MYISKLIICNFRGFTDNVEIMFNQGINVILGQNNSGKSNVLKALSLLFDNNAAKRLGVEDFNRNICADTIKGAPPGITITAVLTESEDEEKYSDDIATVSTWLTKLEQSYEAKITLSAIRFS